MPPCEVFSFVEDFTVANKWLNATVVGGIKRHQMNRKTHLLVFILQAILTQTFIENVFN